jgi:hypothetical protein
MYVVRRSRSDEHLGMVFTSPNTPYMKLFEKFLAKKQRMAIDAWGTDDTYVKVCRHIWLISRSYR